MDLYDTDRPLWVPIQKIRTAYTQFLGRDSITFSEAETIPLLIRWQNLFDVPSLSLRIEIWNDANLTQASYILYDFCSGKKDEYGSAELSLNISQLKEASYKMVYVFFEKDEYGNNKDLDIVFGLRFKKTDTENAEKMVWNTKSWGYIELPRPEILNLAVCDAPQS